MRLTYDQFYTFGNVCDQAAGRLHQRLICSLHTMTVPTWMKARRQLYGFGQDANRVFVERALRELSGT